MKILSKVSKLLNKAEVPAIWSRLFKDEAGQTLVEYALIISLIVIVTAAVVLSTGSSLHTIYCTINSQVSRASTGS